MSDALAGFEQAVSLAERNRDSFWGPRLVSHLGWVRRELQQPGLAREFDARALEMARENPSPWAAESEALINLCMDDLRSGHPDRAAGPLARLEAGARQATWMHWLSELRLEMAAAEHWAACGDFGAAAARATRLLDVARRLGARTYCCTAERVRLTAALHSGQDMETAADRLDAALAAFESHPAPLECWKSARVLGLARERLGSDAQATRVFERAALAIRTIAEGTHDEELRGGFLASPPVREVLERVERRD
jgi:hypothetical protein